MDKIWYRNPSKSEVIGRCGGDEKNPNAHAEPTKVENCQNTTELAKVNAHLKHTCTTYLHCQNTTELIQQELSLRDIINMM